MRPKAKTITENCVAYWIPQWVTTTDLSEYVDNLVTDKCLNVDSKISSNQSEERFPLTCNSLC